MKLLCPFCDRGPIIWVDKLVRSLDGDMVCSSCDHVFHGMGDYQRKRMEIALESDQITMPKGLTRQQKKDFIKNFS